MLSHGREAKRIMSKDMLRGKRARDYEPECVKTVKRSRTYEESKVNFERIFEELGVMGLALDTEVAAEASSGLALFPKRVANKSQICCYCATPRPVPADCQDLLDFSCNDSGKACAIKCMWPSCKKPGLLAGLTNSISSFRHGLHVHDQVCNNAKKHSKRKMHKPWMR
jgi:hypothetical protein